MNKKTLDHLLIALTVLFDLCFIATAVVVAYWIRFESGWIPLHEGDTPPLDNYFRLIPLMAIIWLLTLKTLGLYQPESNATLSAFWRLCKVTSIALIATLALLFLIYPHHDTYSRWVLLLASGFSLVWLFLGRLVLHRFRQAIHAQGVGVSRIALIGNYDAHSEKFIDILKAKSNSGYELVGIIAEKVGADDSGVPYLGERQDIPVLVQKHRLDTLFIVSPAVPNDTILQILQACEGVPVQINVLPERFEFIRGGTTITFFEGIPVLQLQETPTRGISRIVKRLIDIVFSVFALIALSPLM